MENELINKKSMIPFKTGYVQNGRKLPSIIGFKYRRVVLKYPSRINTMAIDPARVALECERRFTPGEILFSVDIPLQVTLEVMPEGEAVENCKRVALQRHAIGIMRWYTGFKEDLKVTVEGIEYPHCGFGSSGRLMAAIAAGINELQGRPISNDKLQVFLAQNHGEEIEGDPNHLMPVQCIGGAASSGLHVGALQVLAGESRMIASTKIPACYRITLAWPLKPTFTDSRQAMLAELANIEQFLKIGEQHGDRIAYRVLHELLPAMCRKDWHTVGEIIEWYRYDLGSNRACSFSHPRIMEWANKLRANKKTLGVSICGISSVGPALYAVSKKPELSEAFFRDLGLRTTTVDFFNGTYQVLSLEA